MAAQERKRRPYLAGFFCRALDSLSGQSIGAPRGASPSGGGNKRATECHKEPKERLWRQVLENRYAKFLGNLGQTN